MTVTGSQRRSWLVPRILRRAAFAECFSAGAAFFVGRSREDKSVDYCRPLRGGTSRSGRGGMGLGSCAIGLLPAVSGDVARTPYTASCAWWSWAFGLLPVLSDDSHGSGTGRLALGGRGAFDRCRCSRMMSHVLGRRRLVLGIVGFRFARPSRMMSHARRRPSMPHPSGYQGVLAGSCGLELLRDAEVATRDWTRRALLASSPPRTSCESVALMAVVGSYGAS
jgi:hypothetical protein